jgi:1-acyl-sn-glycerol-3-phosphate acyltransferase
LAWALLYQLHRNSKAQEPGVKKAMTEVAASTNGIEPAYSGPHAWQIQPWAKFARRVLRYREYLRWVDQYCTRVGVCGTEHLDRLSGPAIFIANHQSHMDTPVLMSALPASIQNNIYFGAAADRWFRKGSRKLILQPWYQSLALGNFPIVRGGGSKSLDYAGWLLDQNCNICIFPEGTRATSNALGQFRHGVTLLAREKRVPVVPVILKGLRELRPKGSREITPGPVSVSFLNPHSLTPGIPVEAATRLLRDAMNKEFFRAIPFPKDNPRPDVIRAA